MEPSSFKIPRYWPRVWAVDVDSSQASVLFCAHDRESDVLYIYDELEMPRYEMALVADAIKARARGFPGLFDHLARGRSQQEGQRLINTLLDLHLEIFTVQADQDAGAAEIARRLSTKRLKVFETCTQWLAQYRSYRRDKDGDIVEESDGLMRATDLLVLEAPGFAAHDAETVAVAEYDWSGKTRSSVTGY